LGWTVAAMKPEAQPLPHQDSRQAKAAVGCDSIRKAAWLWHLRTEASPVRTPSQARSVRITQDDRPLCIDAGLIVRAWLRKGRVDGLSVSCRRSWRPARQRRGQQCYCTTGAAKFVMLRGPAFGWARIKGCMGRRLLKRARQVCRARRAKNSPGEQLDELPLTCPNRRPGQFLPVPPAPPRAASTAASPCPAPAVPLRWPAFSS